VRAHATAASLPRARVSEVVLAAHEVAMNALVHGRGQGLVRVFEADGEFVCEVEDSGPGMVDTSAGLVPPEPGCPTGRGLWMARQLCELVEIESSAAGTLVRLRVRVGQAA
jgi:anti-sigma regulatory factor (Ser/Thr protein kinase)